MQQKFNSKKMKITQNKIKLKQKFNKKSMKIAWKLGKKN